MKSSVIVTTHNRPYYLDKVLHGYLHQTCRPYEVVIADDGSRDETRRVIEKYQALADFPILHAWHPFGGSPQLSKARNAATRLSGGDYLIYTDGDCIPCPNFVADHQLLARPGYYVQGRRNFLRYQAFAGFTGQETRWKLLNLWRKGGLTRLDLLVRIPGLATESRHIHGTRGCNIAAWRSDVETINGWNEQFVGFWRQDSEFVTRLIRAGIRRRNALFSAVLFHMEHDKDFNQNDFDRNNALLEQSQSGPIFVEHGLMPAAFEADPNTQAEPTEASDRVAEVIG